ncbi:MAG: YhbY family RNA-binding protein [Pseudomonadota bacterium]
MMKKLKGFQRKYLRGLTHKLKPVVLIGQKGLTDKVLWSTEKAFEDHELIKIKWNYEKLKSIIKVTTFTEPICRPHLQAYPTTSAGY